MYQFGKNKRNKSRPKIWRTGTAERNAYYYRYSKGKLAKSIKTYISKTHLIPFLIK